LNSLLHLLPVTVYQQKETYQKKEPPLSQTKKLRRIENENHPITKSKPPIYSPLSTLNPLKECLK
jgi:hypothetical protein